MRRRKRKPRNSKKILAATVVLVIVVFISVINLSFSPGVIEKKILLAKVIVGDMYGFDLNSSALTFGMLVPGGTSSRGINLVNKYNREIKVDIYSEGDITKFIQVSENNFILKENEAKSVSFTATAPLDAPLGTYEGVISIIISKSG